MGTYEELEKTIKTKAAAFKAEAEDLEKQRDADETTMREAEAEKAEAVKKNDQKSYNAASLKYGLAHDHFQLVDSRLDVLESGRVISEKEKTELQSAIWKEQREAIEKQNEQVTSLLQKIAEAYRECCHEVRKGNRLLMEIHSSLYKDYYLSNDGEEREIFPPLTTNDTITYLIDAIHGKELQITPRIQLTDFTRGLPSSDTLANR